MYKSCLQEVWYFVLVLVPYAHGMYYLRLRATSFGFFPLTLLCAFKEKIKLMTAITLHMGDAHDKKDVDEF